MLAIDSCYKILQVNQDCSDLQIRQQFRKIALKTHPDKLKSILQVKVKKNEIEQNNTDNSFVRVNKAYKYIINYRRKMKNKIEQYNLNENKNKYSLINNVQEKNGFNNMDNLKQVGTSLSKVIQQSNNLMQIMEGGYSSYYTQIDKIYQDHLNILAGLEERLKRMRQK